MSSTIPKEHRMAGQGAVLATAFLWSLSGLFIKLLPWYPIVISGARSILAAIFLLICRLIFPSPKDVKNTPGALWASALAYAATMITFVLANKLTTTANAVMLQYGAPVWAALLGWWLIKEKPHWEQWGALVLVMGGLLLFFKDGLGSGTLLGDGTAVISGIVFGAFSVFLRMMKDSNPRDAMLLSHVISGAFSIPFMILYPPSLSVSTVLPILFMGFIQIGLASLLFSYGIKHITAFHAMLILLIEPVLNPVWVLFITGEKPSAVALAGGTIIITSIVGSSLIGKRREDHEQRSLPPQ